MKFLIGFILWLFVMALLTAFFWLAGYDFNSRGFVAALYGGATVIVTLTVAGFVTYEFND